MIECDLSEFIDQYRAIRKLWRFKQVIEQRGLAATEESGEDNEWYLLHLIRASLRIQIRFLNHVWLQSPANQRLEAGQGTDELLMQYHCDSPNHTLPSHHGSIAPLVAA